MLRTVLVMLAAVAITACGKREEPVAPAPATAATTAQEPATAEPAPSQAARVELKPTQGHTATGDFSLTAEDGGVHLTGQITGLRPGSEHGIHVHEKGDCSAPDASSAGAHFNPTSQPHGNPDGAEHHAGDMYNIKADDQGNVVVDTRAPGATLRDGAATDVLGKSVVLHDKADDYKTQPAGSSGDRIACGVIS